VDGAGYARTSGLPGNAPWNAWLDSVSCAAGRCQAVGSIEYQGGLTSQNLDEEWISGKWVIQPTPAPAGGYNNDLLNIGCVSATSCTSIGEILDSDTRSSSASLDVQALTWNGIQWRNDNLSDPSEGAGSVLSGIACKRAHCIAVGYYNSSDDQFIYPLAEQK
jgi:hypothetical protein